MTPGFLNVVWKNVFDNPDLEKVFRRFAVRTAHALTPDYRGIYLTAYSAGSEMGENLMKKLKDAGGNMIIFDLKEADGHLFFPTTNEINKKAGGNDRILFEDPKKFVEKGKQMGFYMVARIVCFRDDQCGQRGRGFWR